MRQLGNLPSSPELQNKMAEIAQTFPSPRVQSDNGNQDIAGLHQREDLKSLRPHVMESLAGLDVLILNCLRETREHASHLVLEQSVRLARELRPKRCCFTHMSHDIHYRADAAKIEPWMEFRTTE